MSSVRGVYIRLFEMKDAEQLLKLEIHNKEFFQKFAPMRKKSFYTLEGQKDRIREYLDQIEKDTAYAFGIFHEESHKMIGSITLSEVARGNYQSCWIGYFLDKEHNGKGYMTEAVQLAVEFAFKDLDLHRVEAGVIPHNKGSIKVLEKAGFHMEGLCKENVRINGKWEDHQLLAIINKN